MSRVVYVGHVPFDMTEEQIEDIFRSAGPVEQTRLVFDRNTGKSKGFAFVQYFEQESAASAVRNLDNYKIGNMHLKVNYSSGRFPGNSGGGGPGGNGSGNSASRKGTPEETGAVPEIVNMVSEIPPPQKFELLRELKTLIAQRKEDLRALLDTNPHLSYAIVQCLFELGMIDGNVAGTLIVQQTPAQQQPPTKKSRESSMQPSAATSSDNANIYRQIMALTPEQLESMPAEQRKAALAIRAQVDSGAITL